MLYILLKNILSSYYYSYTFFGLSLMKLGRHIDLDERNWMALIFLTLTLGFKVKVTPKLPFLKVYFENYDICTKSAFTSVFSDLFYGRICKEIKLFAIGVVTPVNLPPRWLLSCRAKTRMIQYFSSYEDNWWVMIQVHVQKFWRYLLPFLRKQRFIFGGKHQIQKLFYNFWLSEGICFKLSGNKDLRHMN